MALAAAGTFIGAMAAVPSPKVFEAVSLEATMGKVVFVATLVMLSAGSFLAYDHAETLRERGEEGSRSQIDAIHKIVSELRDEKDPAKKAQLASHLRDWLDYLVPRFDAASANDRLGQATVNNLDRVLHDPGADLESRVRHAWALIRDYRKDLLPIEHVAISHDGTGRNNRIHTQDDSRPQHHENHNWEWDAEAGELRPPKPSTPEDS